MANLDVATAARIMGVSQSFIRSGIRQKAFPWGYAVLRGTRYTYYINEREFRLREGGEKSDAHA